MSDEVKRFTLKNVEDFLLDNELKNTKGGSDGSGPSCYKCWRSLDVCEVGEASDCISTFGLLNPSDFLVK